MERILTSWIGFTDIRASKGSKKDEVGPVCQAIQAREFDEVDLISDLASDKTDQYIHWLASFTKSKIVLHDEKLTGPTNFSEIHKVTSRVLIGELPWPGQVKLLRVLLEKEVTRLGSTQPVKFDTRIIIATNRDLIAEIAENRFREDLIVDTFRPKATAPKERPYDIH